MVEWLKLACFNLVSLVGGFVGFGLVLGQIEAWNNQLIASTFGKIGIILTGAIGTVVHEGSHYLMCLVFRHEVTEVKWFRPLAGQTDGILGYVQHSYNKQSVYQTMGNFFIGIAPMIGGTLVMIISLWVLLPEVFSTLLHHINAKPYQEALAQGHLGGLIKQLFQDMGVFFKALWGTSSLFSWRSVLFWVIVYAVSTHMALSPADLKGSFSGLMVIALLVLVLTALFALTGLGGTVLSTVLLQYNVWLSLFFSVGLVFSLLTLGASYLFSLLF